MKKTIFLTTILLSLILVGNAQKGSTDNREKFQVGAKAGISISNIYDANEDNYSADAKVGFAGGLFVAIPIGKYFGIQPEIMFSQKGYKRNFSFLGTTSTFKRTSTFIDVPILIAIKPIEWVTLFVGPQYSFLIRQRDQFNTSITSANYDRVHDFDNGNIRRNILGIVVGADLNIQRFVLSARVGWDMLSNSGDGDSTTPRYKNVSTQITIGYKFL